MQDWDGILFYDYDGSWGPPYWQNEEWRDPPRALTFALATDPVKWPQTAAGALMFLRGDVQAARELVERALPENYVYESLRMPQPGGNSPYWMEGLPGRLSLVHRALLHSLEAPSLAPAAGQVTLPTGRIESGTGELTWEETPGDGHVLVDTPKHQVIIGRTGRRATRNMALDLKTPFASVQLAALEDKPIAEAERLLLVTGARVANTGMRWLDETHQSLGENWGTAPTRLEPVTGTLTLRGLQGAREVWLRLLDARGQPMGDPQPCPVKRGTCELVLDGVAATPWYLIEVRRGM